MRMYCCRVIRELDAVKQEAALLQDQMKMVKQDIQKVFMSVKYRADNFSKWTLSGYSQILSKTGSYSKLIRKWSMKTQMMYYGYHLRY